MRNDRDLLLRYFRMSPERFDHLLTLVREEIEKKDAAFRKSFSAAGGLTKTLRYLGSGETQQSLLYNYRIGRSAVSTAIAETCKAIYTALKDRYLKSPSTEDDWRLIAARFEEVWNFPHVLGAMDGKHIRIERPKLAGALYHNYKGFSSMVLLAVCDADYIFTLFDFGSYGSNDDCGALSNSLMGEGLETNTFNIPEDEPLDRCEFTPRPYFLLGDDIFPLKKWFIQPYPHRNLGDEQKIYNYRLCLAQIVIENAFGISIMPLADRWRIFHRLIRTTVEHVELYVLAALALHNYLRLTRNAMYTPSGFVDFERGDGSIHLGEWRNRDIAQGFNNIRPICGNRNRLEVVQMRDEVKEYLNSEEGSLLWQLGEHTETIILDILCIT